MKKKIDFYMHDLGEEELEEIAKVFKNPILTTGDTVARFEKEFASFLDKKFAYGVTSCTAALHLSLLAVGIKEGDEVITSPMTFLATANAIIHAGAKPVFVDVEKNTGNIDPDLISKKITNKTKAIIPIHLYGQMCDMKAISRIANQNGLRVIEDCAHCVEGVRDGIKPGDLSDAACFSFFATKNLTCGEGGAITTNNKELADLIPLLRLHGMTKTAADRFKEGYKPYDMSLVGWKYNMDNIQAAILLPQLKRVREKLQTRRQLANHYANLLSSLPGICLPETIENTTHAHHLFPVWLRNCKISRNEIITRLKDRGIITTVNYSAIHLYTYFKKELGYKKGDFPVAELIGENTISLPFYPSMDIENIAIVVSELEKILS